MRRDAVKKRRDVARKMIEGDKRKKMSGRGVRPSRPGRTGRESRRSATTAPGARRRSSRRSPRLQCLTSTRVLRASWFNPAK
uniref:Uncharacterized protein n=1 Tax=Steinernema glaseri TaxID=37863 RepID=A0A1I7ZLT8_9BILA